MKKVLSLLLALSILFLVSCGKKTELLTPEEKLAYREENPSLFYNPDCQHDVQYERVEKSGGAVDGNVYHMAKCRWGHCDYETHPEPHAIDLKKLENERITEPALLQDDGMFYHAVIITCPKCGELFTIYVYCPLQDKNCTSYGNKNTCLVGCDWREILCDTPYEILDG